MKHSIKDLLGKIKGSTRFQAPRLQTLPDDLFLGLIIVLVAFGSFGLGRLSKIEGSKTPIRIENAPLVTESTFSKNPSREPSVAPQTLENANSDSQLVGSKGGKKYYYSWCAGASKISPANLVQFASRADAEERGYTPSGTCKGI